MHRARENPFFHLMAWGRTVNRKGDMVSGNGLLPPVRSMPYTETTKGLECLVPAGFSAVRTGLVSLPLREGQGEGEGMINRRFGERR